MKKVLFIVSHRKDRAPNQRFRFEQYLKTLEERGFQCTISPLIATAEEDQLFYSQGNVLRKIPLGFKLAFRRIIDVWRARQFHIIFIAREAFVLGYPFFEKAFSLTRAKIVFDFDDSIWMNVVSANNKFFGWIKSGSKTASIIKLSDFVLAGNEYLADYARNYNTNVRVLPTTIDTNMYQPCYSTNKSTVTIGWSGSFSTIEHFKLALPALQIIKQKYGHRLNIKVIGDKNYRHEGLGIQGVAWNRQTEIQDLQAIDIGIMPLPNDEWAKGKCGLKGLQYMALEIPTIMSPVGVNKQIINNGLNGFLADETNEWVQNISKLVENPDLRLKIGKEGRKTVVSDYSIENIKGNYVAVFQHLVNDAF